MIIRRVVLRLKDQDYPNIYELGVEVDKIVTGESDHFVYVHHGLWGDRMVEEMYPKNAVHSIEVENVWI